MTKTGPLETDMRCGYLLLISIPFIFAGCGKSQAKTDPTREFVRQVASIMWDELRREELTSLPVVITRYRQFGLRLKALQDAKVDRELATVTQDWASAAIEFSNVMVLGQQIQSNDSAIADGAVRLVLGESPATVWDRADSALKAKQQFDGQLEIAHARMTALQTDFFRIRDRLYPELATPQKRP